MNRTRTHIMSWTRWSTPADEADAWLERLRARDETAFELLVRRHQNRVYSYCLRMLNSPADAEEIAQECFIKAWQALPGFRGDAEISTWLLRIARNLSLNRIQHHRRRGAGKHDPLDETAGGDLASLERPPATPEQQAAGGRLRALVEEALGVLPPDSRELIILRDIEGMEYEEITRVTGLCLGTLKSRLHRARSHLADALRARGVHGSGG
ncbi:MAG: ECF RNA polymerase sigma-E factor [Myxococcota bacterium]|nr:ECF RNA polymerase sigma-E factor [Myxococcota bacterium]